MSNLLERKLAYAVSLHDSAARTATSTGTAATTIKDPIGGIVFELDLTAAATDAGDTLNVYVQTTVDGTNWVDVVAFTQCLGNGGAKRYFAKLSATEPQTMFENATALTAGNVRHLIGDQWRVRWDITDASTANASFTFSVTACPI